jgi:hypothetical protein
MVIHGNISFMNGIVNTYDENVGNAPEYGVIRFRKGATWSGASNTSNIDGWVGKEGDEPFTFPVGENGIYAPLTISAPVGQSEIFFARYNRASGSELGGITDPGLFNISSCEYWDLMPGNGQYTKFYPLSITVGWNGSSGCGTSAYITNVSEVTLAHFDRATWNSHGGTATGTTENGSVTWSGVTTFSPFTLGNIGTCKTPLALSATNITGNSATLSWPPVAGAESYDVYYATFPTAPVSLWTIASTGTKSTFVYLSGLNQASRYYYRVRANCSAGSSSYRQSEFTTLTVCDPPTWLVAANITNVSATLFWAPVPGATSYHVEYEYHSIWTPINEVITTTSYTLDGLNPGSYYSGRIRANCPLGSSHYQYVWDFWVYGSYCEQPTSLTTTNITNNSATLNWAAVTNASNYNVEYKQSTSAIWLSAATGLTSLSYTLNALSTSTGYDWRVLATCFASVPGNYAQSFFTSEQAPPPHTCNDIYETNNTSSQTKTISIGSTISAGISSATDIDWFKLTTLNNNSTSLEITLSNLPADYDLYFYDKKLKLVASSTVTGTSNEVVISTSSARNPTYYIKVVGKNGAYTTSQCYTLLVQAGSTTSVLSRLSDRANEKITDEFKNDILFPNPANEFVILGFNSDVQGPSNIQIMNTAGQLVKLHLINLVKGYNQVRIPVQELGSAMYLLQIKKGELNIIKRFVITR